VEAQKLHAAEGFAPPQHNQTVALEGLEDLFQWASEMVADGVDTKSKKLREQRIRRNVLEVISKNKEHEAQEKVAEEVTYLQKRVIALLQIISERTEEISNLKQVMVGQYFQLEAMRELEKEVKQLRQMTWYREEAEEERKHLMTALARMKKERDFLDELLQTNETENDRLAKLLKEARTELQGYTNRTWWQRVIAVFK
jgi:predicted amino acid-binding ACT domain protein